MENVGIKFEKIDITEKKILLDILGYAVDENGMVLNKERNEKHICPITKEVVFVENASVLPGSTVVINTSELSVAEYLTKFVEETENLQ